MSDIKLPRPVMVILEELTQDSSLKLSWNINHHNGKSKISLCFLNPGNPGGYQGNNRTYPKQKSGSDRRRDHTRFEQWLDRRTDQHKKRSTVKDHSAIKTRNTTYSESNNDKVKGSNDISQPIYSDQSKGITRSMTVRNDGIEKPRHEDSDPGTFYFETSHISSPISNISGDLNTSHNEDNEMDLSRKSKTTSALCRNTTKCNQDQETCVKIHDLSTPAGVGDQSDPQGHDNRSSIAIGLSQRNETPQLDKPCTFDGRCANYQSLCARKHGGARFYVCKVCTKERNKIYRICEQCYKNNSHQYHIDSLFLEDT